MPLHPHDTTDNPSLHNARLQHLINAAVVAAILFDPTGAKALLDIPDAELGRRFKTRLMQVIGVATALNLDLSSLREEDEKQGYRTRRRASELGGLTDFSAANVERYSLVLQGKLLCAEDFCEALGITEKRLSKDIASGRIFSVEFEAEPYYPAFFLSNLFDRKDFAKVARRLGDSAGWTKWEFVTTPAESLGGLTPLRLLMREEIERALKAAADFAER